MKVYISGGRPLYILSEAQKEEVIAQADSHLKTAKGRGYRRQVTHAEVVQLLSSLPRDAAGLVSFHDAQQLVTGYRDNQIARFRVIFPDVTTAAPRLANNMRQGDNATALTPNGGGTSTARYGTAKGGRGALHDGGLVATTVGGPVGTTAPARRPLQERGREGEGGGRRRAKFSPDVAPSEMFVKDVGFTPAGMAKHVRLSAAVFFLCALLFYINAVVVSYRYVLRVFALSMNVYRTSAALRLRQKDGDSRSPLLQRHGVSGRMGSFNRPVDNPRTKHD